MKRLVVLILFSWFPALVLADSGSLSFAPPSGDYSVLFLGNLFGVVDGVLHGTGSQIMGTMFGVFNSAVLAIGGIIIMYTLMVSTMNTAHEGQMLGQKWSSIWIPVRSTLGLALLIPKASGYCLMQIFVMWIVIQGVGAADKIWEAALSYLNRGGVIIQAQASSNPTKEMMDSFHESPEVMGAKKILIGQVCMLGLQKQLEAQRQEYLAQDSAIKSGGPCSSKNMKLFCQTAVPDFIGSVNPVIVQNNNKNQASYSVPMPNFDSAPYADLNGICGKITWSNLNQDLIKTPDATKQQNSSEQDAIRMSRAIAVREMYLNLAILARVIVNNDPQIGAVRVAKKDDATPWAIQQFGVPYTKNAAICYTYGDTCTGWGAALLANTTASSVLFNGNEFQNSISAYKAIMLPTLRLMQQSLNAETMANERAFIADANSKGWIMAGSYFFDLVKLNGNAMANANLVDSNSGLDESKSNPDDILNPFVKGTEACKGNKAFLCEWFGKKSARVDQIVALIAGSPSITEPSVKADAKRAVVPGASSSTVYGFVNNSLMVQIPDQPGLKPMDFPKFMSFTVDSTPLRLEWQDFACGGVTIIFFKFCLGWMLGNLFYNIIFLTLYNTFILVFAQLVNQVVLAVLMIPLQGMSDIFKQGIMTLSAPGVNPVVALANMGVQYINFAGNLWIMLLTMSAMPIIGVLLFPIIALAMPLILAWVGIMVGIGFTTAYYIPLLPYMIFTFGTIGWLITVIEAMVAAPLVALGVTHPEGHDAFGKGESAIMILMNVFLRPAMMIIGFIAAIALSYVGVWVLNAGYNHAVSFIQGGELQSGSGKGKGIQDIITGKGGIGVAEFEKKSPIEKSKDAIDASDTILGKGAGAITGFFGPGKEQGSGSGETRFTEWAGIYAFFFSILIYTMMYLIIVQKSFTLITHLPDKVLRWIGGQPESSGAEAAQWGEDAKRKGEEASGKTLDAQAQVDKQLGAHAQKGIAKIQGGGVKASATGRDESTPSPKE